MSHALCRALLIVMLTKTSRIFNSRAYFSHHSSGHSSGRDAHWSPTIPGLARSCVATSTQMGQRQCRLSQQGGTMLSRDLLPAVFRAKSVPDAHGQRIYSDCTVVQRVLAQVLPSEYRQYVSSAVLSRRASLSSRPFGSVERTIDCPISSICEMRLDGARHIRHWAQLCCRDWWYRGWHDLWF